MLSIAPVGRGNNRSFERVGKKKELTHLYQPEA